MMRTFT